MTQLNRRNFLKLSATAAASAGLAGAPFVAKAASHKVVVVGGGAGGTIAAKYIRMMDPSVEVTLIEANPKYHTCFMSNEVLGGDRTIESISFGYEGLKAHGINVVHTKATAIDADKKVVKTEAGDFPYDRAVVSPGIDFIWDAIEGYDASVAESIPHAWKAGPQTVLLRKQLEEMKDGGVVAIAAPPNPFRCPPGPYERASQIAHYLKQHKPKSKIIILDAKAKFSKQGLFTQGWTNLYGYGTENSLIEWHPVSEEGQVKALNQASMTLISGELDTETKADVINIIPPQRAGAIAVASKLTDDSGWCPVDKKTFESTLVPGVHVIGDASIATSMPKSAYSANSQAKVCAAAVLAALSGKEMVAPSYVNTCYSIVGEDYGISVAAVYRLSEDGSTIAEVEGAGGLSPADASAEVRKREVAYAHSWFNNITQDMFG